MALIVVAGEELTKFAKNQGLTETGLELLDHATIQALFEDQIQKNSASFKGFEIPKRFKLLAEEWTVENGLLTPTMKLKRTIVEKQFSQDLESLYG